MSNLIEIKILDEILIIGCENNSTIAEIAIHALNEYEKSYTFSTPKSIQHVKDKYGRILSSNLQLIQLNLDKYLEIILHDDAGEGGGGGSDDRIPRHVDPKYILDMYGKWQDYAARSIYSYCDNIMNYGELPSKEALYLLDDLKNSSNIKVQQSLLKSYQILLIKIKNELIFQKILNYLLYLLLHTTSFEIVRTCLKIIFQLKINSIYSNYINNIQLMNDISQIMKQFPENENEILALCDQYGQTTTTTATATNTATTTSPTRLNNQSLENISLKLIQNQLSSRNNENIKRPNSSESNGMSFDRIIELLSSSDIRCKEFALEKLEKKDNKNNSNNNENSSSKDSTTFLTQIITSNRPMDSYQLLRVLFDCLKSSLRPPTQQPQISNHQNTSSIPYPITYYIIESALSSEFTLLTLVTSSLRCIYQVIHFIQQRGDEWIPLSLVIPSTNSLNTLENILSDKWRLLLTLSHGNYQKYPELVEQSAEILLMFVRACGWEKYRIKLDYDTLLYFLNSDIPLYRTYLGLEYLIYCVESSQKDSSITTNTNTSSSYIDTGINSSHTNSRRRISSSITSTTTNEMMNSSSLNSLFCDDNYLLLRLLWRWIIGNYGIELTYKALHSFSIASVLISVKTFLIKFQIYDKVGLLFLTLTPLSFSTLFLAPSSSSSPSFSFFIY